MAQGRVAEGLRGVGCEATEQRRDDAESDGEGERGQPVCASGQSASDDAGAHREQVAG